MALGPHVIKSTNAALAWTKVAPIVKALNTVEPLKAAPDSAIRIFRQSYDNESDTNSSAATVNRVLAGLNGYTHPNLYLQLWCGAHPSRAILKAAVALCHNLGYKTVGSSWFTGDYTQKDWDDATAAGVDAYGPQCYFGNHGFTLDHAVRYRRFWKPGQKPVMILEAGRDEIEGGKPGWQISGVTAEQYVDELIAYNAEIAKDNYVLGATVFTAGPTPDWDTFSTDPISAEVIRRLPGGTVPPLPTPTEKMSFIDVSNLQGKIDWGLVAKSWPQGAIIKASQGTWYTDAYFPANWQQAAANGLVRGAYAFGEPGRESGHDNATFFLSRVAAGGGWQKGDLPVLDLEWDTGIDPNADLLAYTLDWLQTVEAAVGCKPWFYSRQEYMQRHNLMSAQLANYGLWLAAYDPFVWPSTPGAWPFLAAWQYGQGSVPGIQYAVDHDLFNGTRDLFLKYGKP